MLLLKMVSLRCVRQPGGGVLIDIKIKRLERLKVFRQTEYQK